MNKLNIDELILLTALFVDCGVSPLLAINRISQEFDLEIDNYILNLKHPSIEEEANAYINIAIKATTNAEKAYYCILASGVLSGMSISSNLKTLASYEKTAHLNNTSHAKADSTIFYKIKNLSFEFGFDVSEFLN